MADAVDNVIALTKACLKLRVQMHCERCAEKLQSAIAAARALGFDDCLIVASLTAELAHTSMVRDILQNPSRPAPPFATLAQTFALLRSSATVLRRRRDAGTLQPCRPEERRFGCAYGGVIESDSAVLEQLFGYVAYLHLCNSFIGMLTLAVQECAPCEQTREMLAVWCDLLDDTVILVAAPRLLPGSRLACEARLYDSVQDMIGTLGGSEYYSQWQQRVSAAFARLQESGVVEARGLQQPAFTDTERSSAERVAIAALVARNEAAAAGQLKRCSLASCGVEEAHIAQFSKCAVCRAAVYCCTEHQAADWPAHRAACVAPPPRAAAASQLRRCCFGGCGAREARAFQFRLCSSCKTVVYCSKDHQTADWPAHKAACKAARKAADSA